MSGLIKLVFSLQILGTKIIRFDKIVLQLEPSCSLRTDERTGAQSWRSQ